MALHARLICPVRLVAQDTSLSRWEQGFETPTGRQNLIFVIVLIGFFRVFPKPFLKVWDLDATAVTRQATDSGSGEMQLLGRRRAGNCFTILLWFWKNGQPRTGRVTH